MNADPFRLRVLMRLTEIMKEITPANGYTFDLSDFEDDEEKGLMIPRVYRTRTVFGAEDPLPCLSMFEPPQAPDFKLTPPESGVYDGPWVIYLQGFVPDDPNDPNYGSDMAYRFQADVRKRLATEKIRARKNTRAPDFLGFGDRSGNVIVGMSLGAGVVRPADEVSAQTYFYLPITFDVVEDMDNPFA